MKLHAAVIEFDSIDDPTLILSPTVDGLVLMVFERLSVYVNRVAPDALPDQLLGFLAEHPANGVDRTKIETVEEWLEGFHEATTSPWVTWYGKIGAGTHPIGSSSHPVVVRS